MPSEQTPAQVCGFCGSEARPATLHAAGLTWAQVECLTEHIANAVRAYLASDGVVERAAEACWQQDSIRATDRPRNVPWDECALWEQAKWRLMARAALTAAVGDGK